MVVYYREGGGVRKLRWGVEFFFHEKHHQKSWISRIRCGTLLCHTGEPDRYSFNTKLDKARKYTKLDRVKKYTKLEGLKSIQSWTWPKNTQNWTGPKTIRRAGQGHNLTHGGHSQIICNQYVPDFNFFYMYGFYAA